MKPVKKLTFTSMMAALALVLLLAAGFLPTLSISLAVIAGFCVAASFLECGRAHAFLCYLTVSLLALLLVTDKMVSLSFALVFGLYPIFKSFAEAQKSRVLEYVCKLAFCNVMLCALYFLFRLFTVEIWLPDVRFAIPVAMIALNLAFLIYDMAFTKLVTVYRHYRRRFKK